MARDSVGRIDEKDCQHHHDVEYQRGEKDDGDHPGRVGRLVRCFHFVSTGSKKSVLDNSYYRKQII